MGYRPDDEIDDTWAGLVPEQPKTSDRLPILLVIGGVLFVLICLCSAAIFFLGPNFIPGFDLFGQGTTAEAPEVPTVVGTNPADNPTSAITPEATVEVTQDAGGTTAEPPAAASPTLVATVTLLVPTDEAVVTENVIANRLETPPAIDGNASDWGDLPVFESFFTVYQDSSWDGSDDLTAIWRFAWDDGNLYFLVEVTDDTHVQTQTGNQLFRGDSVDIQFDTELAADLGDGLSPDDHQITFSPGDFASIPPSAWHFQGTDSGQILDAPGGHHVSLQATQMGAGYVLEAAIPWADLNLIPSANLVIGIALNANDNDTAGTAVQEIMKSHVSSRTLTDPSSWGTLTLQ